MSNAFYYKLYFDETNDNAAMCTHYELQGIERNIESRAQYTHDWPQALTFFHENGKKEDLLGNALGWWLISKRVKEQLMKLSTAPLQFLPVTVVDTITGSYTSDYSVLNVLLALPALHKQHSLYRASPNYPERLNVIKVVLAQRVVDTHPIFRLKEFMPQIYVSEDVKNLLESLAVSGFRFIPTKVLP